MAPSLGVVELILACHSVLDCPHDKLLSMWATSRMLISSLRAAWASSTLCANSGHVGGLSEGERKRIRRAPFRPCVRFGFGGAGSGYGTRSNGGDEKIVTIIGDASLSGGMAFEALNQLGQLQTPMVIILNDNEMSISRNVGALARYLGEKRASREYTRTRDSVQKRARGKRSAWPRSGRFGPQREKIPSSKWSFRARCSSKLGITCTAPIPGHDIAALKRALRVCLEADGPTLLHVVTKKGKGYEPAEENPSKFHGIGPYDIATGEVKKGSSSAPKYTSVFSKAIVAEAERDHDIVAITAAMKDGTGLAAFSEKFPKRFIDTGIAEEHAVALASGLALGGKKPVVCIYSTFMQRAFDQLVINNAPCEYQCGVLPRSRRARGRRWPLRTTACSISHMVAWFLAFA